MIVNSKTETDANTYRRHDDPNEIFVVVAEFKSQAPIVMEAEWPHTNRDRAEERAARMRQNPDVLRTCIARLVYESGNELLLKDLKRMQK